MILDLLAQATQPSLTAAPPAPTPDAPWYSAIFRGGMIVPLLVFLPIFYFLVIRAKKTEEKKKQATLNSVKRGDQIETIGGIMGTVVSSDDDSVVLKVDETANTKIRFNRRAIHRVLAEEK